MLSNIIVMLSIFVGIIYLYDAIRGKGFKHIENIIMFVIATVIVTLVAL